MHGLKVAKVGIFERAMAGIYQGFASERAPRSTSEPANERYVSEFQND